MTTPIGAGLSAEQRADRLKERVYITFTALAVVLALRTHAEAADEAARTMAIAVIGTLLAVFVADVVSHIAVHAALPTRAELVDMVAASFGALGAVLLPFVFVGLAVRRLHLPGWQRIVVLLAESVLGIAVVGLELLAHGWARSACPPGGADR